MGNRPEYNEKSSFAKIGVKKREHRRTERRIKTLETPTQGLPKHLLSCLLRKIIGTKGRDRALNREKRKAEKLDRKWGAGVCKEILGRRIRQICDGEMGPELSK